MVLFRICKQGRYTGVEQLEFFRQGMSFSLLSLTKRSRMRIPPSPTNAVSYKMMSIKDIKKGLAPVTNETKTETGETK